MLLNEQAVAEIQVPRESECRRTPAERVPLSQLTDQQLLVGLRRASEAHFNELYARYFQRIYNFTYGRLRNHADAEEVVQETFTVVYRSVDRYRGQASLLSWIYGIAKNTVNNHLRRSKVRAAKLEKAEMELKKPPCSLGAGTPEDQLNLRRYAEEITLRLRSASQWQVEIFMMRHVEDLSIREIADRTARSSDAIRSSLYRVKRLLLEASNAPMASSRA